MAWPISRVFDQWGTAGIVMPHAPASLSFTWYSPRARDDGKRHNPLEIDLLAMPNSFLDERRIPSQSASDRIRVCTTLARIGALFEKYGIVYADWSYSNAFWHPVQHSVFLLDVDGCSFGARPYVTTPNFDDPLTPPGSQVDNWTDRYRAALLIGRCLTTRRDVHEVVDALRMMIGVVPQTLSRMITADARTHRPSLAELAVAFDGGAAGTARQAAPVDGTGVVNWRPVRKTAATSTNGASNPTVEPANGRAGVGAPREFANAGRASVSTSGGVATTGPIGPGRAGAASPGTRPAASSAPSAKAPSTAFVVVCAIIVCAILAGIVVCGISVIGPLFA
jgi:hypothetical protein